MGTILKAMLLNSIEARVLGSLIEKEITTPEYYPLSLNALLSACNQKSSREPVLQLTEREVREALRTLEDKDLVTVDHGSRVERYENRARTVFQLRRDETAVLCLLLLRGAQTPGELRSRADRLFTFDDISGVLSTLQRLGLPQPGVANRAAPLVFALGRQPGAREQRFVQLLSESVPEVQDATFMAAPPAAAKEAPRLDALKTHPGLEIDQRLATLETALQRLQQRVATLEEQLGPSAEPDRAGKMQQDLAADGAPERATGE